MRRPVSTPHRRRAPARAWPATFPRRPGRAAGIAAAVFVLVTLDTAWRGPLSAGIHAANDVVGAWHAAGWPVHPAGRWLSHLGEYVVCGALAFLAAILAFAVGRPATGWAALASGAAGLAVQWATQTWLSPLNWPMPRLDPYLVPDTDSPLRIAGEHLYPSGHTFVATLGYGWLLLVAVPLAVAAFGRPGAGWVRPAGVAAWVVLALLTGLGRLLRQAHGYNDVLGGWAAGAAVLFGGLWLQGRLGQAVARRHARRR